MSFLTVLIVENSHILAGIGFIFLKELSYTKVERLLIPNLDPSEKSGELINKQVKFFNSGFSFYFFFLSFFLFFFFFKLVAPIFD